MCFVRSPPLPSPCRTTRHPTSSRRASQESSVPPELVRLREAAGEEAGQGQSGGDAGGAPEEGGERESEADNVLMSPVVPGRSQFAGGEDRGWDADDHERTLSNIIKRRRRPQVERRRGAEGVDATSHQGSQPHSVGVHLRSRHRAIARPPPPAAHDSPPPPFPPPHPPATDTALSLSLTTTPTTCAFSRRAGRGCARGPTAGQRVRPLHLRGRGPCRQL